MSSSSSIDSVPPPPDNAIVVSFCASSMNWFFDLNRNYRKNVIFGSLVVVESL